MGVGGQGHSGREDKLKEPLEKQPGPTSTTTPQQGLQSSCRVQLKQHQFLPVIESGNRASDGREEQEHTGQLKVESRTEAWRKRKVLKTEEKEGI